MRIQIKILNKEFYGNPAKHHCNVNFGDDSVIHKLPSYATSGSVAMDLVATKDVTLMPGEVKMIPTGLAIWIESASASPGTINSSPLFEPMSGQKMGIAGLILPRSGLGTKGLVLANTIGVIDEDYQGELLVSALNRNTPNISKDSEINTYYILNNTIEIKTSERFAQLMFVPVIDVQWDVVEEFSDTTSRGTGGFGSTSK